MEQKIDVFLSLFFYGKKVRQYIQKLQEEVIGLTTNRYISNTSSVFVTRRLMSDAMSEWQLNLTKKEVCGNNDEGSLCLKKQLDFLCKEMSSTFKTKVGLVSTLKVQKTSFHRPRLRRKCTSVRNAEILSFALMTALLLVLPTLTN